MSKVVLSDTISPDLAGDRDDPWLDDSLRPYRLLPRGEIAGAALAKSPCSGRW